MLVLGFGGNYLREDIGLGFLGVIFKKTCDVRLNSRGFLLFGFIMERGGYLGY